MQRLRSPFRLRPGPGPEQRRGKGRKEEQQPPDAATPSDASKGRASGSSTGTPSSPDTEGPQASHTITGAGLRKRRAEEAQRSESKDHPVDPTGGSE